MRSARNSCAENACASARGMAWIFCYIYIYISSTCTCYVSIYDMCMYMHIWRFVIFHVQRPAHCKDSISWIFNFGQFSGQCPSSLPDPRVQEIGTGQSQQRCIPHSVFALRSASAFCTHSTAQETGALENALKGALV